MKNLRTIALISAKLALVYMMAGTTATTGVCGTTAYSEEYHIWSVEYQGNYYEYIADRYDNPESFIVTLSGEKIYVKDIIGGETK